MKANVRRRRRYRAAAHVLAAVERIRRECDRIETRIWGAGWSPIRRRGTRP